MSLILSPVPHWGTLGVALSLWSQVPLLWKEQSRFCPPVASAGSDPESSWLAEPWQVKDGACTIQWCGYQFSLFILSVWRLMCRGCREGEHTPVSQLLGCSARNGKQHSSVAAGAGKAWGSREGLCSQTARVPGPAPLLPPPEHYQHHCESSLSSWKWDSNSFYFRVALR